jgi:hypothetical protein
MRERKVVKRRHFDGSNHQPSTTYYYAVYTGITRNQHDFRTMANVDNDEERNMNDTTMPPPPNNEIDGGDNSVRKQSKTSQAAF